ncbi:ABC transporter ATP-binding protein [Serratia fonticola]|jgi:NitT/TauT family transport system ATP-binding protein|uniref:ABC transporter ATP-binding protein n=2 Tax=Serratia TaxID=613 RepID=UPI0004A3E939|nr:ABC transporter ATP-binding protein [Serratia fonticola]MBE0152761.1 ABC transporter ATP-binding protein [Serratia fonticola]HBE9078911.1 ABC transporter ATP-binding protein [Serratia fonticola]HBE9089400.1 ABC transporter ATP-binding protein [Serratia fonticola]HBE9152120.1 ABC transporter ATP-binding protein [Serratia fonticola]
MMAKKKVLLTVSNVSKSFQPTAKKSHLVLSDIDLKVYDNEVISVLGKSGSGKSTLLRIISGLISPDFGDVMLGEDKVSGPNPQINMVFQNFAIFPWLTVYQNIAFGLQAQHYSQDTIDKQVIKMLNLIGLEKYRNAFPRELSGGMRQRVGFARALVVEPELLLLDEPFSSLDIYTGKNLRSDLMQIWSTRQIKTRSMILVTHSVTEAVMMSDRIILLGSEPATVTGNYEITLRREERNKRSMQSLIEEISAELSQQIATSAY